MTPFEIDRRIKELAGKLLKDSSKEDLAEYEHLIAERRRQMLNMGGRSRRVSVAVC